MYMAMLILQFLLMMHIILKLESKGSFTCYYDVDHVFSSCHPYSLIHFPSDLKEAIDKTIKFLKISEADEVSS